MSEVAKCKITVIKRMFHQDLVDEYLKDAEGFGLCDRLSDGQEFVLDTENPFAMPDGFCPWAWADIRHDLMTIVVGGNMPWYKQPGTLITSCTDWFRPVIFKVERME